MSRHPVYRLTAIALLAVGVALATHGCGGNEKKNPIAPGPGGAADVTINIVGIAGANSFSPSPDTVTVGQTVSWKNNDGVTHTSTADGGAWNTTNIAPGGTSTPIAMNTAASFGYHCTPHPAMTGILVVKP